MREIKFRAFNKEEKRMYFVSSLRFGEFGMEVKVWIDGKEMEVLGNPYELMQYAGIKDMKEVEVYEGDIIKRYCPCVTVGCTMYWIGEVAIRNGSLIFRDHNEETDTQLEMFAEELLEEEPQIAPLEVIGNIYENPELVEKE